MKDKDSPCNIWAGSPGHKITDGQLKLLWGYHSLQTLRAGTSDNQEEFVKHMNVIQNHPEMLREWNLMKD